MWEQSMEKWAEFVDFWTKCRPSSLRLLTLLASLLASFEEPDSPAVYGVLARERDVSRACCGRCTEAGLTCISFNKRRERTRNLIERHQTMSRVWKNMMLSIVQGGIKTPWMFLSLWILESLLLSSLLAAYVFLLFLLYFLFCKQWRAFQKVSILKKALP